MAGPRMEPIVPAVPVFQSIGGDRDSGPPEERNNDEGNADGGDREEDRDECDQDVSPEQDTHPCGVVMFVEMARSRNDTQEECKLVTINAVPSFKEFLHSIEGYRQGGNNLTPEGVKRALRCPPRELH